MINKPEQLLTKIFYCGWSVKIIVPSGGVCADSNTMSALSELFKTAICIYNCNCKELFLSGTYSEASFYWGGYLQRVSLFFQQLYNDSPKIRGGGFPKSKFNACAVFMIKMQRNNKFAPFLCCYFRVLSLMNDD